MSIISSLWGILFLFWGTGLVGEEIKQQDVITHEQRVIKWREERDQFFKTNERSPLSPKERKYFKGITYYPFYPQYVFHNKIERFIFHINNPKYYATFLTNKGINKRYIRYGKFHFMMNGEKYTVEVYKSILSDTLFIPFRDKTNGRETYGGGRYVDAEILPGYQMVLDFNMAYNPACVYNEKLVCVLPPKENALNLVIRAGEKNFKSP
jgi:uncharacterized protein (DUF1684 family)